MTPRKGVREVEGPTVFVLGAGASVHAGAPLLRDFLARARDLSKRGAVRRPEAFENVFRYVEDLLPAAYHVDVDLKNLEHVWSLAELQRQMGLEGASEVVNDLKVVVGETLDQLVFNYGPNGCEPDEAYKRFVKRLLERESARAASTVVGAVERETVITFNYDVLLDHALLHRGVRPNYSLGTGAPQMHLTHPVSREIVVLKLHGSINWGQCPQCEKLVAVASPTWRTGPLEKVMLFTGQQVSLNVVSGALAQSECPSCRLRGLEPYMVPPTWSKRIEESALVPVWQAAATALKTARQLVVMGYSMPESDTFMRYLLATALKRSPQLERVVVVNPNVDGTLEQRYRSVFATGSRNSELLKFVRSEFWPYVASKEMDDLWVLG